MSERKGILNRMFSDIFTLGKPSQQEDFDISGGAPQSLPSQPAQTTPPQTSQTTPIPSDTPASQTTPTSQVPSAIPASQTTPTSQVPSAIPASQTPVVASQTNSNLKNPQTKQNGANNAEKKKPGFFSKMFSEIGNNSKAQPLKINQVELHEPGQLFKRYFAISFMVLLSIFLASITFRSKAMMKKILKLPKEKSNPDPLFDPQGPDRSRRVMQMLLVFVLLVITFFVALIFALFAVIAIFLSIKEHDKNVDIVEKTLNILKDFMWKFDLSGKPHLLLYFYALIIILLFVSMLVFMLYHTCVKSYLPNISYPAFANNPKLELSTPTKFAIHYGLYIAIIYIFMILLLAFYYLSSNKMIYGIIFFIITMLMFIMLITKYTIERSGIRIFILWIVYFLWTTLFYMMLGSI